MDWNKHKELYDAPNMSKLLFLATQKWQGYQHDFAVTKTAKQAKLKLINCNEVLD